MTVHADIDAADAELARLVRGIKPGEDLVLERGGKPVARVVPVPPATGRPRQLGLGAGQMKVPPDFDAPLPDDLLDAFEGR